MNKYSVVKDFEIEWETCARGSVCRFTHGPNPEYLPFMSRAITAWHLPAYSKNGRFDRAWLLKMIHELWDCYEYPILGMRSPGVTKYNVIPPTSRGVDIRGDQA